MTTTPNPQDDKELLELAAKAAGLTPHVSQSAGEGVLLASMVYWSPLTDDGDALRLAVKLNIGIRSHGPDHWQQPNVSVALYDLGESGGRVTVHHGDDPSYSTRRAIVRAAAEIARQESSQ